MAKLRQLDPNGITWHAMSGYPRLENLATNPSFEATNGTTDIWKNLATNPSFEAVATGTTTMRRNLATTQTWYKAAANDLTITSNVSWDGSTWTKITQGTSGSKGQGRFYVDVANLINGFTYTASATVANTDTVDIVIKVDWCDVGSQDYTIAPGETRRVSATGYRTTYDSTFRFMDVYISEYNKSILVKDAMVEQTNQPRPFFDGNTPDALGWDYGWEGTAGSSVSSAKAAAIDVYRNLIRNPAFRGLSGTSNVWTNKFPNPASVHTTGVVEVRRNHAINPIGVGTATGYGQQTITDNVAITGHPEGITTATRVAYGSGNATPGITFMASASTNTQYTISAWIYHETIGGNLFGFAQQAVISGSNLAPSGTGTWERRTWTMTTGTSTNPFGFRLDGSASGTGSYLITGILVEKTPTVLPFFSGATPAGAGFTYPWTGTAHASESVQQALGVTGTAVTQGGTNYQSPYGTKYRTAVRSPGTTSDSFAVPGGDTGAMRHGMVAGRTYTVMGTIDVPVAQTGTLNGRARQIVAFYRNANGDYLNFPSASGATTGMSTIRHTFTIPSDATEAFIRFYNGSGVKGETVYWSDLLLVEGSYSGPYFDGSTSTDTNVALGAKTIGRNVYNLDKVTNGGSGNVHEYYSGGDGLNDVTIDLGVVQPIDEVKVWHYYGDGRTYYATKTEVSEDGTNWFTIFDSAVSGTYPESNAGKTHTFAQRNVRYIRDWLNGSSSNGGSHWIEIQAFRRTREFTHVWVADANNSPSHAQAPAAGVWIMESKLAGWVTPQGTLRAEVRDPSGSGGRSFIPNMLAPHFENGRIYTILLRARKLGNGTTHRLAGTVTQTVPLTSSMADYRYTFTAGTISTLYFETPGNLNDGWEVERVAIVEGTYNGPYFDGSTQASGDFTYAWTGAANTSESVQQSVYPAALATGNTKVTQSFDWKKSGNTSLRVSAFHPTSNATSVAAYSNLPLGTYTAIATRRLTAPLTGTLNSVYAGTISVLQTGLSHTKSEAAPNVAGEYTIRYTFTIEQTNNSIRLGHGGGEGSGDVWWDDFTLVSGTYDGPHFDGSITSSDPDITNLWLGTPHASESVQRVTKATHAVANTNSGAKFYTYVHTDPDGTKCARYVAPKGSGVASWRVAGSYGMDYTRIKAGRPYTLYIKHRASSSMRELDFIGMMDGTSANKVLASTIDVVVPATWGIYRTTFIAERDALGSTMLYIPMRNNDPAEDWVYDIAEWMLVEGEWPDQKYFDGSFPEDVGYIYSWSGAEHASTSIALPK